jgi:hypothetical protein
MSERDRLDATGGPTSKSETAQTTRVLRDDELDAVSGASAYTLQDCLISGYN